MRGRVVSSGLTLAAVLALGSCSDDVGITVSERFVATLTGDAERPTPVTTSASGTAEFTYIADIPAILFRVDVAGIDSAFAAHIHAPADATAPAGIVVNLFTTPPGPATKQGFSGNLAQGVFLQPTVATVSLDSLLVLLRNGHAYVNVHTQGTTSGTGTGGHPGGELRGQISKQ